MLLKQCVKCTHSFTGSNFYKNKKSLDGLHSWCKDCVKKSVSKFRLDNPLKVKNSKRKWEKNHPQKDRLRGKRYRLGLRQEVLRAYGGKCACCGESTFEFLTIDHINNDGAAHKKILGGNAYLNRWLKANNYPKDNFQLLCMNCNFAKGVYGACPHANPLTTRENPVTLPLSHEEGAGSVAFLGDGRDGYCGVVEE